MAHIRSRQQRQRHEGAAVVDAHLRCVAPDVSLSLVHVQPRIHLSTSAYTCLCALAAMRRNLIIKTPAGACAARQIREGACLTTASSQHGQINYDGRLLIAWLDVIRG